MQSPSAMKTLHPLLLPALLLLSTSISRAQLINGGFEEWGERQSVTMPTGWTSQQFGTGRTSDAEHPSAVGVWNWYYYGRGILAAGEWEMFSVSWENLLPLRTPLASTPVRLNGSYYYRLGENLGRQDGDTLDSAAAHILITRWNPMEGRTDTVLEREWFFPPTDGWVDFSIDISSDKGLADSMAVVFRSSANGFCSSDSGTCCYLYLDDLTLESTAGVATPLFPGVASRVSPNPATTSAEIVLDHNPGGRARLRLMDERGAEVRRVERVEGTRVVLDCRGLPSGAYTYLLEDTMGHSLSVGRLLVSDR